MSESLTYTRSATHSDSEPAVRDGIRASAEPLRALFVLNSLGVGGSETKIVRVLNALWERGVRVAACYLNEPSDLRNSLHPQVPVWHLQRRGKFSLAALHRLARLLREQRPAVVFTVNLYPALYGCIASRGLGVDTIALLNTTHFARRDEWRRAFYRPFLRRLDRVVYGCELQRQEWRRRIGSGRPSEVIYNGVDVEAFSPTHADRHRAHERERLGIGRDTFVIGSVGRLVAHKNQRVLIDALAHLRGRSLDAHLLLVGQGPMRDALEERVRALGLERHVTFAGLQHDVRPALAAMDVFVLPSTHVETFSNAALEAMAMGKPVVLSRIGGAREMIRDGVEGFTIEPSDLEPRLKVLLAQLCADGDRVARLGQAARERAVSEFSLDAMVSSYAALIERSSHDVGGKRLQ